MRGQLQHLAAQPAELARAANVDLEHTRSQLLAVQQSLVAAQQRSGELETQLNEATERVAVLESSNEQLGEDKQELQSRVSQTDRLARKHAVAAANLRAECRRASEAEQQRAGWERQRAQLEATIAQRSQALESVEAAAVRQKAQHAELVTQVCVNEILV